MAVYPGEKIWRDPVAVADLLSSSQATHSRQSVSQPLASRQLFTGLKLHAEDAVLAREPSGPSKTAVNNFPSRSSISPKFFSSTSAQRVAIGT